MLRKEYRPRRQKKKHNSSTFELDCQRQSSIALYMRPQLKMDSVDNKTRRTVKEARQTNLSRDKSKEAKQKPINSQKTYMQ